MQKETNPLTVIIIVALLCGVIYAGLHFMRQGGRGEDQISAPQHTREYEDPSGKIVVPPGVKMKTQQRPSKNLGPSQMGKGTATGDPPATGSPRGGE